MLFWEKNLRKRVESLVEKDNSPLSLDEMNEFQYVLMSCGPKYIFGHLFDKQRKQSCLKKKTFLENILEKLSKSRNFAAKYKMFN